MNSSGTKTVLDTSGVKTPMEKRQEIQRALYIAVVADAALLILFVVLVSSRPSILTPAAVICFLILLISNLLFLRHKKRVSGPRISEETSASHSHDSFLYLGSAIFFVGTLYGVVMISRGELPRTTLPALLVPLSLAIYCLRTALRGRGAPKR